MRQLTRYALTIAMAAAVVGCAGSRGSSQLGLRSTNGSAPKAPRIKAESELAQMKENDEKKRAESAQYVADRIDEAKQTAEATKQQFENKAEEVISNAKEETIVVRSESVKIIESENATPQGKFHIIIGSFKVLENARTASGNAVKDGFLPSIMENDEGMYRVAVFSGDEATARKKIHEMRQNNSQYVGIWLLAEK